MTKENVVLFTKVIDPEKAEHKLSLAMKKLKYSLDSMDKPLLYYVDWRKQTLKVVRRIQERSKWSGVCECHFSAWRIPTFARQSFWGIMKNFEGDANTSIWWNRLLRWIKLSTFENGILWKSKSHLKIMRIEELQIAVNIDTAKEVWKWQWKYKPRIMPTTGIRLFSNRWICNAFRSYLLIENEDESSGMTSTKR